MRRRVLVLGATGMLGHTLLRELDLSPVIEVFGTARQLTQLRPAISRNLLAKVQPRVVVDDFATVRDAIRRVDADVIINCVGVIKQSPTVADAANTIAINALFPHLLAKHCSEVGARLIHVSTDCVFSGDKGSYTESDCPDPVDLYGRSKLLGEVDTAAALTLRTSIIGHELTGNRSLVDWFLSQHGPVRGYTKAIYSGVTTVEFARLVEAVVLDHPELAGLFHVASSPIAKYDLLELVAREYGWRGTVERWDDFVCDRSMVADRLFDAIGYRPPNWPDMVARMHEASASGRAR